MFEEPKVEVVEIDLDSSMLTKNSNCLEDQYSGQGGGSCIGNQDHSTGDGCGETAASIAG